MIIILVFTRLSLMIQLYRVERIFTMGFGSNWNLREEVLPVLLDLGTPKSSFPIYSVVFHEVGEYEMIKSGLSMKTTNDLFGCPLWGWEVNCVQIHKKTIKWSNSPTTEDNKRHIQACALSLLETSVFHVDDYYHIIIISLYHHHYQIIIIIHAGMCPLPFGNHCLPRLLLSLYNYIIIIIKLSLLFMQACALSLLETCVFHVDVAEAVADTGPDLVDYCVRWGFLKPSFLKSS